MSSRIGLAVLAAAAVAGLLLMGKISGGPPPPMSPPRPRAPRPTRSATARPPASNRNVFEYAARPPADPPPRPAAPVMVDTPPVVVPPAAPAVRLVGLVRRAGALKAALLVHGESMTVGMGESAGGYTVVGIDDDGVTLKAADGTTVTLSAGGS